MNELKLSDWAWRMLDNSMLLNKPLLPSIDQQFQRPLCEVLMDYSQ
jgi:hypothetical protein